MDRRALPVLVALVIVLSGCSMLGGDEQVRQEQAVEALAEAETAANETTTYRYAAELGVVASAEGQSREIDLDIQGRVNVSDRRLATTTTTQGRTLSAYVVDDTAYEECGNMARPWGVEDVSTDGDWRNHGPLDRQLSLLESGSLYYNGTESVDGTEAIVLVGEPTTEALTQYQERRSGNVAEGANVEDPRIRVWLDSTTNRLLESRVTFDVTSGDATAAATLTTDFEAYGDPVSITVPAEATNQETEIPCPGA